jgi:YfiH family protein
MRWDAPGPYEVFFSTRAGGVSDGAYDSLNLGLVTDDEPSRVDENRRRLLAAAGADEDALAWNYQQHGTVVRQAAPGHAEADGLWTDVRGRPMLVIAADCLPLALARTDGERPALALVHAGWRGLLGGIAAGAAAALGGGPLAAVVGPAIGPCCYEVGDDVAGPYRDRFGAAVAPGRRLDLWAAAEHALRDAGCVRVDRFDLCTSCRSDLFFSHRRDRGVTGRQGAIGYVA